MALNSKLKLFTSPDLLKEFHLTHTLLLVVFPKAVCWGLSFFIYTNDLPACLDKRSAILFANDSTVYYNHKNLKVLTKTLNTELDMLREWFCANRLLINPSKTNYILFHHRPNDLSLGDIDIRIGHDRICRKSSC